MKNRYEIKEIPKKARLGEFLSVPSRVNRGKGFWVSPLRISVKDTLNHAHNPFWEDNESKTWIAKQNGHPVGRIMAIRSLSHPQAGHFGFLEGTEDLRLFEELLLRAETWLRARGCEKVIGPFNPGINYELGVLTEGFDRPPYFMMSYNPAYYDGFLQELGYTSEMDFVAYDLTTADFQISDRMERISARIMERNNITFRPLDFRRFREDCLVIRDIYNDAFAHHWGYVPFEEEEFLYMAKDMKQILDRDLLFFLEVNGEPAGFILALPNWNEVIRHLPEGRLFPFGWMKFLYYRRKIETVRVINVAIKQRFQPLGIGPFLYRELRSRMQQKGYKSGEMSWVAASNKAMNEAILALGATVTKRYRVYQKSLIQQNEPSSTSRMASE